MLTSETLSLSLFQINIFEFVLINLYILIATPEIDFPYQLSGLDKSKLTLYAIHPLGSGKSRPPFEKSFRNHYQVDSQLCGKLMKKLGVEKYSVLG